MPTIGWFEILIVVAIAIVVLGPKDFPIMLKKIGSWTTLGKKAVGVEFKMAAGRKREGAKAKVD